MTLRFLKLFQNFVRSCGWGWVVCCWLGLMPAAVAQPIGSALPPLVQPVAQTSAFSTLLPTELAMGSKPLFSFSGTRPTTLGVKAGKLLACPNTPNCVNSQTAADDKEHAIAPIGFSGSSAAAWQRLKDQVRGMERTAIVQESDDYLYAEFTSALMGYVDDVEFYLDPSSSVIHVRSASRLGQSDLGVNRKRIETIRAALSEAGI